MKVKMTFTIPEDVAKRLKETVAETRRSAFVTNAVNEKLKEIERREFEGKLAEDYVETREEDRLLNAEWEPITIESWLNDELREERSK